MTPAAAGAGADDERVRICFGKLVCRPGISALNVYTYYTLCAITLFCVLPMNVLSPFVLTTVLDVDELEAGEVIGTATLIGELVGGARDALCGHRV